MKKRRENTELDTETTIADMNIEGFSWYDPSRKKNPDAEPVRLTGRERRAMIRAALITLIPFILCVVAAFALVYFIAYAWLK